MKWLMLAALLTLNVFAANKTHTHATTEEPRSPEFRIDKGVVDKIYEESKTEVSVATGSINSGVAVMPRFSLVTASEMKLTNNYFDVTYSDNFKMVPMLSLVMTSPLTRLGAIDVNWMAKIGYTFKETLILATAKSGGSFTDLLRVHWLPVSGGTQLRYPLSSVIAPYVEASVGAQWLYQTGKLDGIEQSFWIPFGHLGAGINFLGSRDSWFGGVSLGVSAQRSLFSEQTFQTAALDLGLTLTL